MTYFELYLNTANVRFVPIWVQFRKIKKNKKYCTFFSLTRELQRVVQDGRRSQSLTIHLLPFVRGIISRNVQWPRKKDGNDSSVLTWPNLNRVIDRRSVVVSRHYPSAVFDWPKTTCWYFEVLTSRRYPGGRTSELFIRGGELVLYKLFVVKSFQLLNR